MKSDIFWNVFYALLAFELFKGIFGSAIGGAVLYIMKKLRKI